MNTTNAPILADTIHGFHYGTGDAPRVKFHAYADGEPIGDIARADLPRFLRSEPRVARCHDHHGNVVPVLIDPKRLRSLGIRAQSDGNLVDQSSGRVID